MIRMIRSIITISALGFALAGCTSAAPTIAPAPAPAPVGALSPMQQYQSAIEQAQNSPEVQAGEEWLNNQSPQLQQMVGDIRQQQERNVQQVEEQYQTATSGVDCQGGPNGATVCEGGSADENQKAEQQGDTEYMEFCQQQATKPAMCQQMGY